MKTATFITAALLAGCASSPQDIRSSGTHYRGTITKPPAAAARCIARNAENLNGTLLASVTDVSPTESELTIRSTLEVTTTISTWTFTSTKQGADYQAWVARALFGAMANHVTLMRGPC